MTYGYSQRLAELNRSAELESIGVALGRECIRIGLSVRTVAEDLGVSRMTIYNWFTGASKPSKRMDSVVKAYLTDLRK
jgi:DNA-binding transcriptional regulator YiaG